MKLTSGGLRCHFHWGGECGPTALYGWLFVALHLAFLVLLGRVLAASHSIIYALSVTSVALPVQALWWSMFRIGGPLGMEWYPQVSFLSPFFLIFFVFSVLVSYVFRFRSSVTVVFIAFNRLYFSNYYHESFICNSIERNFVMGIQEKTVMLDVKKKEGEELMYFFL